MRSGFEENWRRRFIERGSRFDDDAAIAGWTDAGLAARMRNFQRTWRGDAPGALWVDAGCGAGSYTRHLAAAGLRVIGLDYSLPSVQKARERSAREIVWAVSDVRRLPLRPGSADGVMCFGVLQALDEPEAAIAELMATVRPGGQVWIDALNAVCLPTLARGALARLKGRQLALRYHRAAHLAELMRRHGAVDVRIRRVPILPPALARLQPLVESRACRGLLNALGPLGSPFAHAVLISARRTGAPAQS
ncbi:MAG: class I SAM-dependent methyltransferase [Gammaproteobacteria bacterium]|nr:class I SAM-dependent methyltransferase [Gammaproteobacteria bacterium]